MFRTASKSDRFFPCAPALTLGLRRVNAGWNFSQNAQVTNIQMQSAAFELLYELMKYATFCSNELYFVTGFTTIAKSWILTGLFNWNVSRTAIIRQSIICDSRWPHFPLIYRVFHGGAMFKPEVFPYNQLSYEDLLDLAPSCAIDRRDNSNYEWSSYSRLREPHRAVVSRRYNGVNKVILDLSHFAKGNYVLRTRIFSRVHNTKITLK